MTSDLQSLPIIERPGCSRCTAGMMLERVSAGPTGFERQLFECPKCDHVEIRMVASDSFNSRSVGWLI